MADNKGVKIKNPDLLPPPDELLERAYLKIGEYTEAKEAEARGVEEKPKKR